MSVDHTVRQNPFPGLRPFTTEEDYLFFGREEQTTELLGLLREHRFLAVVGTSGSGKSSLVRAGLLPALHGGTMAQAGSAWEVLVLRPGGDPMTNLARALVDADLYDPDDAESLPRIVATLNRSRLGLVEAVRQSDLPEGTNLLVVVDQFEELFRFRQAGSAHQEAAAAFVKLLLAAAREPEQRIYIAITMRSDYLGECSHIAGLAEAVNDGEYLIPRLSRDQRRAAIEKPVSVGGGTISHRLVQKLLNDVGDDADHLPVLQHALMRIFDYWAEDHADGEPLDLRHYERAGGLQEALSRHSDEVFDELPADRLRTIAEKLFKALTERGPDNRGIRRPTRLDRLCAIIDARPEELSAVVEAFRRAGRTFLMPMADVELEPHTVIDISHESLMRVWKRLDRWVEEESQSARIYRRLADTAALHAEGKAGIYHDPDLQIALSWREAEQPTEAWAARYHAGFEQALTFLERSRDVQRAEEQRLEAARQRELEQAKKLAEAERQRAQEQKRSAHRLKWLSSGVAVVAGLALIAFGVAMVAWQEAQQKEREAKQNAALAQQKEHEAQQSAERAEASATEAQQNAKRADQSAQAAQASAKEALHQQQIADANFRKALKTVDEYFISVSESRLLKVPGLQPLRKELLQSALAYYEGFVQQHGDDPALQNDLADAYTRVARITGEIGDKAKALETMDKALTIREKLLAQNPKDKKRVLDLAAHYQFVGNMHRELGDSAEALKALDQAHQRLLDLSPQKGGVVRLNLLNTNISGAKAYSSNDPNILTAFAGVLSDLAAAHVAANDLQSALSEHYSAIHIRRSLLSETTSGDALFNQNGQLTAKSKLNPKGTREQAFKFAMKAGQGYVVDLKSSAFDAFLIVRDPKGRIIAQDDDGGEGTDSRLFVRAFSAGDHTLVVTTFLKGQTGGFTLTVRGESQKKAGQQVLDKTEELATDDPKDKRGAHFKAYELKLEAGSRYTIDLMALDEDPKSPLLGFDPMLRIEDAQGKRLAEDDDGGEGLNARLIFRPKEAGVYRFVATSYAAGAVGRYRLSVRHEPKDAKLAPLEYRLAQQWLKLGELMRTLDMIEAAMPYQVEAQNILLGLVAGHPDHELASEFERDLAATYEHMGELLYRQGGSPKTVEASRQKAVQAYRQAVAIRQKLVRLNPAVTELQSELARSFHALANVQAELQQTADALSAYRQATTHQFVVYATGPSVRAYVHTLGRYHAAQGRLYRQLDRSADALANYRQARQYLEKPEPAQAGVWFELAQVRAVCGALDPSQQDKDVDLAMQALQSAVAAGFDDVEQLNQASELAPLRARPDFQKLVSDLRAKSKKLTWLDDFDEAKALAAKEGKDLFVYFGGADWATYDVAFRNRVFTQPSFVDYASKHFVLMKMEFNKFRPIPAGTMKWQPALAAKWGLSGYPYLVLADGQGRGYAKHNGASGLDAKGFIKLMEKYRSVHVRRAQAFQQAEAAAGVQKARLLDAALKAIPTEFATEYADLKAKVARDIVLADPENEAGLRAKYLEQVRTRANALVKNKEWSAALAELDTLLAGNQKVRDATHRDLLLERGGLHGRLGHWDAALADFTKAFAMEAPSTALPWRHLASLLLQSGDREGYRRMCTQMYERFATAADDFAKIELALACVQDPALPVASDRLLKLGQEAVAARPQEAAWFHFALATVYYRAGDHQQALNSLAECRKVGPDWDARVLNDVLEAMIEQRLGNRDKARQALDKAMKWRKEQLDASSEALLPALGAWWDALAFEMLRYEAEALITGTPATADAAELLKFARAYSRLGQWDQALAGYTKVIAQQPDNVLLHIERGRCYEQFKQPEKATADFAKAIDLRTQTLQAKRQALDKMPAATAARHGVAQALADLADTQRRVSRVAEAAATLAQLADIWADDGGRIFDAAQQVAALIPAAAKNQQQQLADLAFGTLQKAVNAGCVDAAAIAVDKQLDPLRPRPQFQQLLADVRVRAGFALADTVLREFKGHTAAVEAVVVTPDGRQAISGGYDGHLRVWDVATGTELRAINVGNLTGLALAADGRTLLVGCHDKSVRLYDLESGKEIRRFEGHTANVWQVALSGDGRWALSASEDKTVRLWEIATGQQVRLFEHDDPVWSVVFSPDGSLAVTGDKAQVVRLWDVHSGKELHRWDNAAGEAERVRGHNGTIWCLAFTPDGSHLVAGGFDGTLRIWEVKSRRLIRDFVGHESWVRCIGFLANPRHMVCGDARGNLIVWDLQTGQELSRQTAPGARVGLVMMPERGRALTADSDQLVRLWPLCLEGERARNHAKSGRLAQADSEYAQAVKLYPNEPALRIERARLLARRGQWQQAVAEFDVAVKAAPADWQPWADRGRCLAMLGKSDQAAADFAKALELLPPDPGPWSPRGRLAFDITSWDKIFSKLLETRREDEVLTLARARRFAFLNQWDKATAEYGRLPASASLEVDLEQACARLLAGDVPGYRKVCEIALKAHGSNLDSWFAHSLARISCFAKEAVGEPGQAVFWGQQAVAGAATPWHVHALGLAHYRAGQFAEATKQFQRSNSLSWGNATVANQLGLALAYHYAGDADQARQWLDKAHATIREIIPPTPNDVVNLHPVDWLEAEVLRREAEAVLNAPHRREAEIALREQQWKEAVERLDQLLKANPDFWPDRVSRARAQIKLHQWDQAVHDLAQAVERAPDIATRKAIGRQVAALIDTPKLTESFARFIEKGNATANQAELLRDLLELNAYTPLVQESEDQLRSPTTWRFVDSVPTGAWFAPDFNDSTWKSGPAPFGTNLLKGKAHDWGRTSWKTRSIHLRLAFDLGKRAPGALFFRVKHDDDVVIYLNGVQAATKPGYGGYVWLACEQPAAATLKPGRNVIAVRCVNGEGPGVIDVGLYVKATADARTQLLAILSTGLTANAKNEALRLQRATLLSQMNRWKEAAADYEALVTPAASDAELLSGAARACALGGRHALAETYCRRLLELRQDHASDWHHLGIALGGQNRRKESIEAYGKAIHLDPQAMWSYSGRADILAVLGQWDAALADYEKALEFARPNERWRFHEKRGNLWAMRGEWRKAADDFAKIDEAPPTAKAPWNLERNRALVALLLNDAKSYQAATKQTFERLGDQYNADQARWLGYASVLADGVVTRLNLPGLLKIAERANEFHKPRLTAALHYRAGQYKQAAEIFAKNAGGPEYLFLAAMAQHKLGNKDEARKLLDEADRWMRQQRDKAPKEAVPTGAWQDWAVKLILEREATALIAGQAK